jgi:hypothetical protein
MCLHCNQKKKSAICTALGFYAPTFRNKLLVQSWTAWPLKMGPRGCPEPSVRNSRSTLRKVPKEHRSHLHRGASLKSSNFPTFQGTFRIFRCISKFQNLYEWFHAEPWLEKTHLDVQITSAIITHSSGHSFAVIALRSCTEGLTVLITISFQI